MTIKPYYETELGKLYHGDCLSIMPQLEPVDLVLTDPPYNICKAEWDKWKKESDYIEFMGLVFLGCQRVLKDNGSFYWFHNDMERVAMLVVWLKENTNFIFKQFVVVDKIDNSYISDLYGSQEQLRNFISIAEYCLFYTFQDKTGLQTIMGDYGNFISIKKYLRNEKNRFEKSGTKLKDITKWTKCFHAFAEGQSFSFPTENTYNKMRELTGFFRREYEDLRREYEDLRYTFNARSGLKNVWEYAFKNEKQYKHPTQKPIKLICDILKYSSNEGNTVLDCFVGSGTTAVACERLKRRWIGIDIEEKYCEIAAKRIEQERKQLKLF